MTGEGRPYDREAITVPLAIPVLLTRDTARAAARYAAFGFAVADTGHGYLIMRRDGVELHMSHVSNIPEPHCVSAYIRVADVAPWFADFERAKPPRLIAVADKPWGMREFHVIDDDGNLLNIGQPLPSA